MSQWRRLARPLALIAVLALGPGSGIFAQSTENKGIVTSAATTQPVDDPDFARAVKETKSPGAIVNVDHRVHRIAKQVQNHLLQVDAIACNDRKIVREFRLQNNSVPLKVDRRQRQDLPGRLAQIDELRCEILFAEQRP